MYVNDRVEALSDAIFAIVNDTARARTQSPDRYRPTGIYGNLLRLEGRRLVMPSSSPSSSPLRYWMLQHDVFQLADHYTHRPPSVLSFMEVSAFVTILPLLQLSLERSSRQRAPRLLPLLRKPDRNRRCSLIAKARSLPPLSASTSQLVRMRYLRKSPPLLPRGHGDLITSKSPLDRPPPLGLPLRPSTSSQNRELQKTR